jgi:hypothetical protein
MNPINYLNHLFNSPVYAADVVGHLTAPGGIPTQTTQTKTFISSIVILLTAAAGIYALWQLLSGGLDYITSAGDKNKVTQAGQKITNAIIGLALIAGSFIIISVLSFVLFGSSTFILDPIINSIQP